MSQVQARVLGDGAAFGRALRRDLSETRHLSAAVAFAKQSGLAELDLESWSRPDRNLRFLAGTNFFLTELALLRRLEKRPGAECRIFHTLGRGRVFHPGLFTNLRERRRPPMALPPGGSDWVGVRCPGLSPLRPPYRFTRPR